jgi:hypothetical protein
MVPWSSFKMLRFVFRIEIDHDIAAEHEVERSKGAHTFAQVNGLKSDHPAHLIAQLPDRCLNGENA